jgi:putative ABC transport system ATP-binding protein
MAPILQLEEVSKSATRHLPLFSHVTAVVDEPSIIHILGKSGQGKSTLLRILGLLSRPDSGTMSLHGIPSAAWSPEQWRSKVSYVAQQAIMLPGSVEDNLRTVSRLHDKPFEQAYAQSLMERLELSDVDWSKPAAQLSGGQKQRLALIRSLLLRPEILLLDEVTASLDTVSKQAVEQVLTELNRSSGTTLIWVTHDLEQARGIGQRIWFLAEQRLQTDCDTASFFATPPTEAARLYLHSAAESANGKEGIR